MPERTCPACGRTFTPTHHNQIACPPTAEDRAKASKRQARSFCARKIDRDRYRAVLETRTCKGCGIDFHKRRGMRQTYCTEACKLSHRSADYRARGITPPQPDPQELLDRAAAKRLAHTTASLLGEPTGRDHVAYRRALRRDPCAYCGGHADALDHIEPKSNGAADGWTNRTAACRLCNSLKGTLPLLTALLWIPPATQYHAMRRIIFASS